MDFAGLKDVLDFAVSREEESAALYARLLALTEDPALKMLLADLEKDEQNHKKLLLGFSRKAPGAFAAKPVTDLKLTDYVVAEPPGPGMTFQDLLILGAKKEQKSIDLYTSLRDRVSEPESRSLFDFLVMQERSHKLKLESEYEKRIMPED